MKIYDWKMSCVDSGSYPEYFKMGKIYEVKHGKVIVEKELDKLDKRIDLDFFNKRFAGTWIITAVKIGEYWYNKTT